MNPILIVLLVAVGIVAAWRITTLIDRMTTWMERRR